MKGGETYHITIEGMEFHAPVGCYSLEREVGCHLLIDVDIELRRGNVFSSDDVGDTLSYLDVYSLIGGIVSRPRHTLENLAGDIISAIRGMSGDVLSVRSSVRKIAPPLGGKVASVAVKAEG